LIISQNNNGVGFEPTYTYFDRAIGKEGDGTRYNSWFYQGLSKYHFIQSPYEPFGGKQTIAFIGLG